MTDSARPIAVLTGATGTARLEVTGLVPLVWYVGTLPNPFTYSTDKRIAIG